MKLEYDMSADDEYVDIWVYCGVRQREWQMTLYRDKSTLFISQPAYLYSPNKTEPFDNALRLPKRVQDYFDTALPQAKTLLILGSN